MHEKKRRQHYVWQYYLKSWTKNNKIVCYRDGNYFSTGTINVVQERDFYRLSLVDDKTIQLIRAICSFTAKGEVLIEINKMLDLYLEIYNEVAIVNAFKGMIENGNDLLDQRLINYVEDIHSGIESISIPFLDSLLSKNMRFLENENNRMSFNHYIFLQYLRTKRIKSNLEAVFQQEVFKDKIGQLLEAWPILHLIYAVIFSAAITTLKYGYTLLVITDESEFITGDQPIINTKNNYLGPLKEVSDMELYYPLSPKIALIISPTNEINTKFVDFDVVNSYNKKISEAKTSFLLGTEKKIIEQAL